MRIILLVATVFTYSVVLPTAVLAHPGHEYGPDVPTWTEDTARQIPLKPDAIPIRPLLVLVVTLFGAAALLGVLVPKNNSRLAGVLALPALTGAVLLPSMGCGTERDKAMPDNHRQARHDVKQLEELMGHFKTEGVTFRSDDAYFYLESNAFPSHPLMVGITAWQQQVPLPQPYTGTNAWRIPLQPVVSAKPISAKKALYRGAIAVAVNGVPIFNALNNRGEDAFLAGELDEYGGHCGRGDDYHYHIAPVHLEKIVGRGKPIAYALDGFPIYGYTDADGKEPADLDEFNGRFERDGSYRYYASRQYPYINGGMRGVVTVRGDQIEPQPRDAPVRPAGVPLRGAKITAFTRNDKEKTYTLKYELRGATHSVQYTIGKDGIFMFVFVDDQGRKRIETYRRRGQP
ncbi:MAG TPA: YHYH protein [Gemmataceae bacterium]|nr:YHYH protein [Gemmataceae bacterium]